jgi:hypothetical protein
MKNILIVIVFLTSITLPIPAEDVVGYGFFVGGVAARSNSNSIKSSDVKSRHAIENDDNAGEKIVLECARRYNTQDASPLRMDKSTAVACMTGDRVKAEVVGNRARDTPVGIGEGNAQRQSSKEGMSNAIQPVVPSDHCDSRKSPVVNDGVVDARKNWREVCSAPTTVRPLENEKTAYPQTVNGGGGVAVGVLWFFSKKHSLVCEKMSNFAAFKLNNQTTK